MTMPWTRWTDGIPRIEDPDHNPSIRVEVRMLDGSMRHVQFRIGIRNERIAEIFFTANEAFINIHEWRYVKESKP